MSTTTLIRPDHRSARVGADVRPSADRFTAPRRFDVHEIERFEAWVATRRGRVEIDLGGTTFLDMAALDAIERAAGRLGSRFVVSTTSPAVVLTLELAEQLRSGAPLERAA